MVGTGVCDTSQEALSLSDSAGLLESSSTSGIVEKANKQRAGRPEGGGASARATPMRRNWIANLAMTLRVRFAAASMAALGCLSYQDGVIEMQMRSVYKSAAATQSRSAQHASLQVALHVTKRHTVVNASDRVRVMVGTGVCDTSQETLSLSDSAGLLYRWSRGLDASACPNA